MKLLEIVVKDAILPDLEGKDRDAVIGELVDALVEAGALSSELRDEVLRSIIKREQRASTGFGHGVAVPHVKHPTIDRPLVAIGISSTGIDFNALDRQPVHSIFVLLSPEEKPEDHLDAMEAIFGNLSQDMFRRFLRQAKDTPAVLTLLAEADAKASVP
jgi:PTS system nitrogen regulatory IIA component